MNRRYRERDVELVPWGDAHENLLALLNSEEAWAHLGGREPVSRLRARHRRYLETVIGESRMFAVLAAAQPVGTVGYWLRFQDGGHVLETGWMVLPDFWGRRIATRAARLVLQILRDDVGHGVVHAYPSVDHPASNAVCRHAGFALGPTLSVEFPEGHWMTVNDWEAAF